MLLNVRNLNIGVCVYESSFEEGVNGGVRLNAGFSVTNSFKPALECSQNPSCSFRSLFNIKPHRPQGLLLCEHRLNATLGCTSSFCSTAVLFTLYPVCVSQEKAHSYSAVALLRGRFQAGKREYFASECFWEHEACPWGKLSVHAENALLCSRVS